MEDVKTHLEFVNNMREALNNLRYAEPWVAADEDRKLCREYHELLLEMIPRFESCSTSPNKEHVDKVQDALHFTRRMFEGMIAMNNPVAGTPSTPGSASEPAPGGTTMGHQDQDTLKPPEVADAKALEGYLPRIKRALFKRSKTCERGEAHALLGGTKLILTQP